MKEVPGCDINLRLRHQFKVATWLRLGLVGFGRDMNFMSQHGLDSLRSRPGWVSYMRFGIATQVLGRDRGVSVGEEEAGRDIDLRL